MPHRPVQALKKAWGAGPSYAIHRISVFLPRSWREGLELLVEGIVYCSSWCWAADATLSLPRLAPATTNLVPSNNTFG